MTSTQSRELHRNDVFRKNILTEKLKEWWMQRHETEQQQRDVMEKREFEEKFPNLQLSDNFERVQTFITRGWSKEISVSKLADCGFCFTGDDDIVVCFSCKGKLKDWDSRDVPLLKHLKVYPRCKFARSLPKPRKSKGLTFDSPNSKIDDSTCMEEELEEYFKSEFNRLMSFRNSSLPSYIDPHELAAAGLFYLSDWSENDTSRDAPSDHQQISHHCCITADLEENIILTDEETTQARLFFPQVATRKDDIKARLVDGLEGGGLDTMETSVKHKYPRHPEYADKNKRLRSFKRCRSAFQIPVEYLAEAGFYSEDVKDEVVCFFCGGQLDHWGPQDDPWKEHVRNFPGCQWMWEHIPDQNIPGDCMPQWKILNSSEENLQFSLESRIRTFLENGWSIPILVSQLAEAGFFHPGEKDTTECISCHVKINDWNERDNPLQKHQTRSPNCEIVKALTEDGEFPHNTKVASSGEEEADNEFGRSDECETDAGTGIRKLGSSLVSGNKKSDNEKFKSEYQRLLSYKNWPIRFIVDPFDLANAGFYWKNTERSVTVKCFACYGEISEWQIGETPYRKHTKLYPSCPFTNNLETGNKKLTETERSKISSLFRKKAEATSRSSILIEQKPASQKDHTDSSNTDVSHQSDNFHFQPKFSNKISLTHNSEGSDGSQIQQKVDFVEDEGNLTAKYPEFLKEEARLDSFFNWPVNHCQPPEGLASAGFFYQGTKDLVVCFQCGGKLLDWEQGDNPWHEHARNYPNCPWLLKQKGMKVTNDIRKDIDTQEDCSETKCRPRNDKNSPTKVENTRVTDSTTPIEGKASLLDEIEKLKDRSLCKICLDDDVGLLLLPCKHLAVCVECGTRIEDCPICRSYAEEKVRVFMP